MQKHFRTTSIIIISTNPINSFHPYYVFQNQTFSFIILLAKTTLSSPPLITRLDLLHSVSSSSLQDEHLELSLSKKVSENIYYIKQLLCYLNN
jgi:hypothetical protein